MKIKIQTKRVYEPADEQDGFRVLVDRMWPRGLNKEQIRADLWLKNVAPSTALRQWFAHDPAKWETFKSRYFTELEGQSDNVQALLEKAEQGTVTLLFAARDIEHNQAVALKEYLLAGVRLRAAR